MNNFEQYQRELRMCLLNQGYGMDELKRIKIRGKSHFAFVIGQHIMIINRMAWRMLRENKKDFWRIYG